MKRFILLLIMVLCLKITFAQPFSNEDNQYSPFEEGATYTTAPPILYEYSPTSEIRNNKFYAPALPSDVGGNLEYTPIEDDYLIIGALIALYVIFVFYRKRKKKKKNTF